MSGRFLDMDRRQWLVLFAAWLGWGFDVFDGLLFNYVAPACVPTLLGLELGTPEAKSATLWWGGALTSLLLVGWAIGGIIFGRVADRIGRKRTLMLTMALYSIGTAACAFAPNIWVLAVCRLVASLGIGGEWAAGASMVAEVVPEKRRVEAGALLYTSAPAGLFLASFVNWQIAGVAFASDPETSWRYVFLCGLAPSFVAFAVRFMIDEPERWKAAGPAVDVGLADLFTPAMRRATFSGLSMALVCLVMWWSCNAFIPTIAAGLAQVEASAKGLDKLATTELIESFKATSTNLFNLGGLIGTLLTVPAAKYLGRRAMFGVYFVASAAAIYGAFGLDVPPSWRLSMYFPIGLTVFGVFGSFTYYLPVLYPTRLRATGAGFCYHAGRVIAAAGPCLVGSIASRGADALQAATSVLVLVAVVPLLGVLLLPWVIETKGRALED